MATNVKPIDTSIGLFSDDQLFRLQIAFGFERLTVLPFFSLNSSIIDLRRRTETARKAVVETERGVLFLKELPWYCSTPEFANYQTDLLRQLGELGGPVAPPLLTTSQQSYFRDRFTGAIFTMQPFLEGEGWMGSISDTRAAGVSMARLHGLTSRVRLSSLPPARDVFTSARELVGLLSEPVGVAAATDGTVRDFATLALREIDASRTLAYAAGYGAERLPVHGDFNPFNLLFASKPDGRSDVVGIVDFDNSCVDDRAHDLGEALVRFGWVKYRGLSSAYGPVPSQFDLGAVASVIAGYRSVDEARLGVMRPLLPAVMTAVALELAAIGLLSSYYSRDDLPALCENANTLLVRSHDALVDAW